MPLQPHIINAIKNHANGTLSLDSCDVDSEDMMEIVEHINTNPKIKSLSLENDNLNDNAVKPLLSLRYVNQLALAKNNLTNQGALLLIQSQQFTRLNFAKNYLINDNIAPLLFEKPLSLINLNLQFTSVSKEMVEKIAEKIDQQNKNRKVDAINKFQSCNYEEKTNSSLSQFFTKTTGKDGSSTDTSNNNSNNNTP